MGSPAVMLLVVEVLELRGLAGSLLHDSVRIGDPRGRDILHHEGGVVGGEYLAALAHLESELDHVVVIIADSRGNALVVDLDGEDAVSVADELGVHREVLGALDPRIDRGVLPDNLVLVRVVKVKTVVHVVLGDGGDGLAKNVTLLDTVSIDCLVISIIGINYNLIVLDPLVEGFLTFIGKNHANKRIPPLFFVIETLLVIR